MTDSKNLNLLVVEDDLEDEQLLCEALIEIEENRQWCNWRTASIVQVDQLADALDCLSLQRFDAVLLNLSLPDCPALLDTFLETHAAAHGAPIIVLADEEDENLANRLLREGAEDVILKSELECGLLARAVRYAIERRRRSLAEQPLGGDRAGILSAQGFAFVAPHVLRLAFATRMHCNLAIVSLRDLPATTAEDREARELLLMRAADILHDAVPAPGVIGRIEKCRFAVILAGVDAGKANALVAGAAAEVEESLNGATVQFSITRLDGLESLETLLADDRGAESPQQSKTVMLAD